LPVLDMLIAISPIRLKSAIKFSGIMLFKGLGSKT